MWWISRSRASVGTKPFDVTTAMTLVASGTYSQTRTATIGYDYSTTSTLAASGAITTSGTGTASVSDGTHTWWNAETGNTSSASSDGTTVTHTTTVTHSEDGDRNEKAALTTNWMFAGGRVAGGVHEGHDGQRFEGGFFVGVQRYVEGRL